MHQEPAEPQDKIFEDQLPPSNYLSGQPAFSEKDRSIVVTWYIRLRKYCKFSEDVLYKTVNTFDRFMAANPARYGDLPLFAAGALATSLGANGGPNAWIQVEDTIGLFNRAEVMDAKTTILDQIDGSIFPAAPSKFLDKLNQVDDNEQAPKVLAQYLLEVMLYDKRFIGKLPSLMAAASYCLAREILGKDLWVSKF
jgi:hypothetical protein